MWLVSKNIGVERWDRAPTDKNMARYGRGVHVGITITWV